MTSPYTLSGRRVLVTGGTGGLGSAMVAAFATAGASVVAAARREPEHAMPTACTFEPYDARADDPADLLDRSETALDGALDVLVHCSGLQRRVQAIDFTDDDWDSVLDVNLTAPFRLSRELGRRQLERGSGGRHIFIASLASTLGLPNMVAYGAAKSGIMGVVRALANEWAAGGITVNAVGPGYIRTELTAPLFDDPAQRERLFRRIPMARFGDPADIAGPTVFLATDAAAYVTGQLLMVDGGWTAS